jgi:hypothetical protein
MSKKHYVVYFLSESAITKTSKEWAEENQECFPRYSFIGSDKPTSDAIDKFLVSELGYSLIADDEKYVCFKLVNN